MQVTLTKVARYTADKTGKTLVTSKGKPYISQRIKTKEYGDEWVSGFGNDENANWKEGDVVELHIERVTKGDKIYLNFSMPRKSDALVERMERLESRVERLEDIERKRQDQETEVQIGDDINPEDIPF